MRILYELSWLWKTLGIALAAAAVCIACAALVCRGAGKKFRGQVAAIVGAAAFVLVVLIVIVLAQTPMPI